MKTLNKIYLIILGVIGTFLIMILLSGNANAQSAHLNWYRNLQESVEYPARIKSNSAYSVKNAKANKKQAKKDNKIEARKERDRNKVLAIREQTANIKNK